MFGEEQDRANTDNASPSSPLTPNHSGDFLSLLRFVYLTARIGYPLQVLVRFPLNSRELFACTTLLSEEIYKSTTL